MNNNNAQNANLEAYYAEERAAYEAHYAEERAVLEAARNQPREYTPDEFAALADYLTSKDQPTQNAEGVHVGDLFAVSWGWEQTNVDFFQAVALKGAHTVILREINGDYLGGYRHYGKVRPMRGAFASDCEYTVRTRISDRDGRLLIKAPNISGDHYLVKTSDFAEHDYSSYA